jgi:octaprenyl-diphosphate synthase
MNLGIAFQLVDDALDYGGTSAKLGKNVGDDFREGKITLPVVLSFRRGTTRSAPSGSARWKTARSTTATSKQALATMRRHRALEDTIERARHYGAMARDALELFPWRMVLARLCAAAARTRP